jgi:hypothetical protein
MLIPDPLAAALIDAPSRLAQQCDHGLDGLCSDTGYK